PIHLPQSLLAPVRPTIAAVRKGNPSPTTYAGADRAHRPPAVVAHKGAAESRRVPPMPRTGLGRSRLDLPKRSFDYSLLDGFTDSRGAVSYTVVTAECVRCGVRRNVVKKGVSNEGRRCCCRTINARLAGTMSTPRNRTIQLTGRPDASSIAIVIAGIAASAAVTESGLSRCMAYCSRNRGATILANDAAPIKPISRVGGARIPLGISVSSMVAAKTTVA